MSSAGASGHVRRRANALHRREISQISTAVILRYGRQILGGSATEFHGGDARRVGAALKPG